MLVNRATRADARGRSRRRGARSSTFPQHAELGRGDAAAAAGERQPRACLHVHRPLRPGRVVPRARARASCRRRTIRTSRVALESTGVLLDWMRGRWVGLEARARELAHAMRGRPARVRRGGARARAACSLARGSSSRRRPTSESARERRTDRRLGAVVAAAAGGLARLLTSRAATPSGRRAGARRARAGQGEGDLGMGRGRRSRRGRGAPRARTATRRRRAHRRDRDGAARAGRARRRGGAAASAGRFWPRTRDGPSAAARALRARAERAWLALPRPYEAARCREARAQLLLGSAERDGKDLLFGRARGSSRRSARRGTPPASAGRCASTA